MQTLLQHVNEGQVTEEEVGQRILTALKQVCSVPHLPAAYKQLMSR